MFDIKSFPKLLKNLLTISVLLPFWYIAVYIYCPELYIKNDLILTISVCIGLSIISCIIIGISFMEKDGILDIGVIFPAIALNVIILSALIFIGYSFNQIFHKIFSFYGFLNIYFSVIMVVSGLLMSQRSKTVKKTKPKKKK